MKKWFFSWGAVSFLFVTVSVGAVRLAYDPTPTPRSAGPGAGVIDLWSENPEANSLQQSAPNDATNCGSMSGIPRL
jgi:hypothetical protein